MPTYTYRCPSCSEEIDINRSINESFEVRCSTCDTKCKQIITSVNVVIPPHMQAAGSKLKYYGVKDIVTGEGITEKTDVSDPPGIRVASHK